MRGAFSTRWVRGGALWSAVGGALSGPLGWEEPQDGQCLGRVPSGCLEKKVCSGVGERTVVAGRWASLDHMSHVALTGRGDGLTEKTEACGGTRDAGLATTGCACCLLMRGPRRQWSRCGAWKQGSGNVGREVLGDPWVDAKRAAGCAAERSGLERQRSHEHPGGKSGVCGRAHLEARCEGGSMQVGTGGEGGGAEKELAEETRSPSQQLSPDGRQQG